MKKISKKTVFGWGNLLFLFIAGFLFGAIMKEFSGDHFRIGFDDPSTVIIHGTLLDIDQLEQKVIRQGLPDDLPEESTVDM